VGYRLSCEYQWVLREDGAFVYSPRDGTVKVVNETGAIILRQCTERSVEEIAASICSQFCLSGTTDRVRQDVEEFLEAMVKEGYLCSK